MLRILFITSATHTPSDRNFNHFQRVYFLSRHTELTILGCKGASFAASAKPGTKIVHAPWSGKAGLLLYGFFWILAGKARQFDIVLTEPTILGVLGFWAKVLSRCKWVVDVWDIPIRCNLHQNPFVIKRCQITRGIMRRLYQWADLFIISILPEYEFREFGISEEKMLPLPNAIWPEDQKSKRIPSSNGTFHLLCMRSVHTSDMGLDTLAQAFLLLQNKIENLSLTIIGRIPEHVKPQIAAIERLDNVRFVRFVEHKKLKEIIRNASLAVIPFKDVPDLAQTHPIKVLEYMSQGTVVVASNIAGMSQMIEDGENGLLFRPGDAEDLAQKVLQAYSDKKLYLTLSQNAMQVDRRYNCVNKNQTIVAALTELVER